MEETIPLKKIELKYSQHQKLKRRPLSESLENVGCRKLDRAARPWEVFTVQLLLCQQQEQLPLNFLSRSREQGMP